VGSFRNTVPHSSSPPVDNSFLPSLLAQLIHQSMLVGDVMSLNDRPFCHSALRNVSYSLALERTQEEQFKECYKKLGRILCFK
jgi:hypothetical protein